MQTGRSGKSQKIGHGANTSGCTGRTGNAVSINRISGSCTIKLKCSAACRRSQNRAVSAGRNRINDFFVVKKEKASVFFKNRTAFAEIRSQKRSAQFAAKLIAVTERAFLSGTITKKVIGGKFRIAVISIQRTAEIFSAARSYQTNLRSAVTLVGFLVAGDNRKFRRVVNRRSAGSKIRRI